MNYIWSIIFVVVLIGLWGLPIYSLVTKERSTVQQLIGGKITISEQSKVIKSQAEEIKSLEAKREEIFKTALEVAAENYALNKVLEDTIVSMKQMIEYIQKLENQSRDRDA